jgi:protein-S-isoprenylcysteine O-methyltransferase Ste14
MNKGHIVLFFLWLMYCVLHSLFASPFFKKKMFAVLGSKQKWYRLAYTIFAAVTLIAIVWFQLNLKTERLWDSEITGIPGIIIGVLGMIIMGICIRKYFMSLTGLKGLAIEQPAPTLMVSGLHRYVRHPLYIGTFMALWGLFLLLPLLSILISNLVITVYTILAIPLEEKKLIKEFGNDYLDYRKSVPALIPKLQIDSNDRRIS